MSRGKGRPSGWDALIRASAKCGYVAALTVTEDGAIRSQAGPERSLAQTMAQGIVFARTLCADEQTRREALNASATTAAGLAAIALRESAKGSLELVSIAWREMRERDEQEPLAPLIPIPNNDPVVAIRLAKGRREEFEREGPGLPPIGEDEAFVWYLELEEAGKDLPRAVARWRVLGKDGTHERTRIAAIWTDGHEASVDRPLIVSASWKRDLEDAQAGAMRWPLVEEGKLSSPDPAPIVATRKDRLLQHTLPVLLHRAIAAWRHASARGDAAKGGIAKARGRIRIAKGARNEHGRVQEYRELSERLRNKAVVELVSCPRGPEARSDELPTPGTGLDAILMAAARAADKTGHAGGGGDAARIWTDTWWARAEHGTIIWHAATARPEPDEVVEGRYKMIAVEVPELLQRPAPVAIHCVNEFVYQTLTQTGRSTMVHSRTQTQVQGIKVPPRLWKAIGEAAPHPEPANPYANGQWWYVEIEEPGPLEPRAVALWMNETIEDNEAESGFAIWTEGPMGTLEAPAVIGWRNPLGAGERGWGWAVLEPSPLAYGTLSMGEHAAQQTAAHPKFERLFAILMEGDGSVHEKIRAAITEHLTRGEAIPLGLAQETLREANTPARLKRSGNREQAARPRMDSIFSLVRAPDPVQADRDNAATASHGGTGEPRGPLTEHHYVRAHYKRQPYGPGQTLRKVICVEGYWRGPEPDESHVRLERLSDERDA